MKDRWLYLLCMALVAVVSVLSTILFMNREVLFSRSNFHGRWEPLANPERENALFSSLQVIDDTRNVLTFEEQKALFAGLTDKLRDPTSAQLRFLRRSSSNKLGICGEVNAKNGFGAYIGFIPFTGGIIGTTALLVIPSREVFDQSPQAVSRQLADFGCAEGSKTAPIQPAPQASIPQSANKATKPSVPPSLDVTAQLTGNVTVANFKEFEAFISNNREKVVSFKLSLARSVSDDEPLQVYGQDELSVYMKTNQTSEMIFTGGYQYDGKTYRLNGAYLVRMAFFAQGAASYRLEPIATDRVQSAKDIRSTSLTN